MDQMQAKQAPEVRKPAGLTRRRFLELVAATSGSTAMLNAMAAMGQQAITGQTEPPKMDGNGEGTKVIVLGAGPGGCPAAWELIKLGYDVTILEARDRVGGHVWTIRGGTRGEEYGKGEQVCEWPEGWWWDAGPSRIPFYHRSFFHYCQEFNIPLIDHNNINLNAWCYAEDIPGNLNGKRIRLHELQADMAGYTSQYLASAIDKDALDEDLTDEDLEMLRDYLINWGLLSRSDMQYHASDHRGYTRLPDTFSAGEVAPPYPPEDIIPFADAILKSAGGYLAATPVFDWQTTLVKPKGGVDRLYEVGFKEAFGDRLMLNCEVTGIEQDESGVTVRYTDRSSGEETEITGDYVMCNIPPSVLIKIQNNFSSELMDALRGVPYAMALRMGIGYNRRFWEEDDWIYGGQSFSNIPELGIIDYPDDDYTSTEGGVMLGMYNFDQDAARVSSLPFNERVELAVRLGSKIHPQIPEEFHSGFSVTWHLEPYSLGAWPNYDLKSRTEVMPVLQEPDGRVYLVGEHLSHVNAWIEGAVQAAWMQVEKLHSRVMQDTSATPSA